MLTRDILKQLDKYKESEEVISLVDQLKQVLEQQKTLEEQKREQHKKDVEEARKQRRELVTLQQSLITVKSKISKEIEALKLVTTECSEVLSPSTIEDLQQLMEKDHEEFDKTTQTIKETEEQIKEISKKCIYETTQERTTPFGFDKFFVMTDFY